MSTTFSYAQAAKGQSIAQPSPQLSSSSAPASVKDDVPTANTSVTAPSVASNEADIREGDKKTKSEAEASLAKEDLEAASVGGSGSSAASVAGQSAKAAQESDTTMVEVRHVAQEKHSRSKSRASQAHEQHKKGRKSRKPRAGDKDAQDDQKQDGEKEKEAPKCVLVDATVPAVNVWDQKRKAQSTTNLNNASATPVAGVQDATSASQEAKKNAHQETPSIHGEATNGVNGDRHNKKASELSHAADQDLRRSAPRGSRAAGKDDKAILPPVADTTVWPDPKSAATTAEESTRKAPEKVIAAGKEGQEEAAPSKKKNWEKMAIDHSALYTTPQVHRGGAKPRGGGRGGRESGPVRGGHGAAPGSAASAAGADKPATVNGSSNTKVAGNRPREGSMPSRSVSQAQAAVAHASKQAAPDATAKDQRKLPNSSVPEHARDAAPEASSGPNRRASSTRDIRTELGANFESAHGVPRNAHERANGNQPYAAREGRPDRGRGNGYRGRGGHANGNGHHISSSYGANGQGSYRNHGSATSPPPFGGQASMPFPQSQRGRGNKWAGQPGRNGANGSSFAVKPSQPADVVVPQPVPLLYGDPLVQIIRQQVEYYFSADNLAKDPFLRRQMDSQGFVIFKTVAGFKRMQSLVQDVDSIRVACSMSDKVEYVTGEDNVERLRARDIWSRYVYPKMEDRDEVARNDGPSHFTAIPSMFPGPSYPVAYPNYTVGHPLGMYPGFADERTYQPGYGNGATYEHLVNGGDVSGHVYANAGSQLSAVVPDFAPPMSPLTLESMTNYSDEKLDQLSVTLHFGNDDSSLPEHVVGVSFEDGPDASSANGVTAIGSQKRQSYGQFRREALEARETAQAGDTAPAMRNLYKLWVMFLLKHFNSGVYNEFRDFAIRDAKGEAPALDGLKHLVSFYETLLLETEGQKPWPQGRAIPEIFQLHSQEANDYFRSVGERSEVAN